MSAFSDYAENATGNFWLRGNPGAVTAPGTVYLALYTDDPTDADAGTEVAGGSYARQAITFGAPTDGVFTNDAEVEYLDMPAASVTHWGIHDDLSAGNLLYHGAWDTTYAYTAGQTATVPIGDVVITHA